MQASGIPIQGVVGRQMQLLYRRQGTRGNSSGFPQIEAIHERESEASAGPYRPQKLSNLHDDEGT